MSRQFSLPVVQEIFPPRPAPAPGAAPQPADARHTLPQETPWDALSQRSLVAASLIARS
jgi:hypothetical protein